MPTLTRVRYFDGQVLSTADFQLEQQYVIERSRLHNRVAHGHGVARGLKVSTGKNPRQRRVIVSPGAAIDPLGNDLILDSPSELAWPASLARFFVVIRQAERSTNPTPSPTADPVYSRTEEGPEIALVAAANPTTELVLARFVKSRATWRRDPKVKARRLG